MLSFNFMIDHGNDWDHILDTNKYIGRSQEILFYIFSIYLFLYFRNGSLYNYKGR